LRRFKVQEFERSKTSVNSTVISEACEMESSGGS